MLNIQRTLEKNSDECRVLQCLGSDRGAKSEVTTGHNLTLTCNVHNVSYRKSATERAGKRSSLLGAWDLGPDFWKIGTS
jgi:hypothetical protein